MPDTEHVKADWKPTKGLASRTGNGVILAILSVWAAFSLFAIVWVLYTSLKTDQDLFNKPWGLPTTQVAIDASGNRIESAKLATMGPEELAKVTKVARLEPQWKNYVIAWTIAKMGQYTANSVIVTLASVFFIVLISAMAAYSIAKSEFFGAKGLFYYFLAGLAVPASLLLVPLFMTLKDFNIRDLSLFALGNWWLIHIKDFYLIDSRMGLILIYTTLGIPFTVFVLTGFFRTLPTALAESAAIDGASEYTTFWRIYLPLAKPGLITVAIFNFLFVWNEYQFALVFISNERLKTLPVGLYSLMLATQHSNNWTALFAGLVILMLPTLLIFIILEDRITKGLTMGAIKS
jgi:N-acetylglucosamine transport system permease protein